MKKILIIGAGFGGVKAARTLARNSNFDVTLVSDRDCFEYHADLYRSATGRSVLEVDIPLSDIFAGSSVEVVVDRIVAVNVAKKEARGSSGSVYLYDSVIIGVGSSPNYYGVKGIEQRCFSIRSINEALRFKTHLHKELEQKSELNFVVVGGGPTGVELAAELVFYLRKLRKKHLAMKKFQVILVEASPRILPLLPEDISRRVARRLARIGVNLHTSTAVKGESVDKLALPQGDINTHSVIWTAGVQANALVATIKGLGLEKGRVVVGDQLSAAPDVFVVGDNAATTHSGLATTAVYDGYYVATNLIRAANGKKAMQYRLPKAIIAVPVGGKWAAVLKNHRRYYGRAGWSVRRHSDYHLYSSVLPPKVAQKTWLLGSRIEESCPTCRG